jgi:putative transposase
MSSLSHFFDSENPLVLSLDQLAQEGARRMLALALEAEVQDYLQRAKNARDERGRALVVRNGKSQPRSLTLGSGTIEIQTPRIDDKRTINGKKQKYHSKILPPYIRRSPNVNNVLPHLYLEGLSSNDFQKVLPALLGENASGLSPSAITKLTQTFHEEFLTWKKRSLKDKEYIYVWVDGVYFNVRLEEDKLAALVIIGVKLDGNKEVISLEDGYRESEESWLSVLRDLKERGMKEPQVAVGDGALGFWKAMPQVWPQTQQQRCWVHKIANILDKLPKRNQGKAKDILHQIMYAETKKDCLKEISKFKREYQAKYPKAVECLEKDQEKLLTFYEYPAEHWKHIRTTNPIESTFATVKMRSKTTKGAGSRKAALGMAFKLMQAAQEGWNKIEGAQLLLLVKRGIKFKDGVKVSRKESVAEQEKAPRAAKSRKVTQHVAA